MKNDQINSAVHAADMDNKEKLFSAAFQAMIRSTTDIVFVKDADLRYMDASDACLKVLKRDCVEDVVGKRVEDLVSNPALVERYRKDELRVLETGTDQVDYIEPIPEADGHVRYVTTSKYVLKDDEGNVMGILSILRDTTQEYLSRQHHQQALQMLFNLPEDAYSVTLVDVDEWRVIAHRHQSVRENTMPACATVEDIQKAAAEGIVNSFGEEANFYRGFTRERIRDIYLQGQVLNTLRFQWRFANGEVRWIHNDIRFLMDTEQGHLCAIIVLFDIDAQKHAEEELMIAAQMDEMTMVLNRASTMRRIRDILATQTDHVHAFFILDIDNFKMLNDTYGHQAGDAYLIELANVLRYSFRESDVVGRIGGDEFFVLMQNISNMEMVHNKARRLLEDIKLLGKKYPTLPLSASMGISMFPESGIAVEELYEKADAALYQVKKRGKNKYMLATPTGNILVGEEQQETICEKGEDIMTLKEFYDAQGGDYYDVVDRLHSEEIVLRFLARFVEESDFDRLEQAIVSQDQKDAFAMIHTFKGTCINMGFGVLAQSSARLTDALRTEFSPEAPALFEKVTEDYKAVIEAIRALQVSLPS